MCTGECTWTCRYGVRLFWKNTCSDCVLALVCVSSAYSTSLCGPSLKWLVSTSTATLTSEVVTTAPASGLLSESSASSHRPRLMSCTLPVTCTMPPSCAYSTGEAMPTDGSVVSTTLMVVLEVPMLPWASTAWKWMVVRPNG